MKKYTETKRFERLKKEYLENDDRIFGVRGKKGNKKK